MPAPVIIATVDVLVVGGGPVGTLIALQLARFGCRPYIIEQDNKPSIPPYGRASTLWPRSIELLDQLDLADALVQEGITTTNSLHFRDGQRVAGGLMYAFRMDRLGDTFHKYALHIRQRPIEEQFAATLLDEHAVEIHMLHRLESYTISDDAKDGYPITATITQLDVNDTVHIKTKYLIGADGGKSTVRKLSSIPFIGDRTAHQWVRMDAHIKTDMPNSRLLDSIDSPTHGQILWCPLDNGRTRIGYVFSDELMRKYPGGFTREVAMSEAEIALRPFEIEWIGVPEWFVLYGIGQCVADEFFVRRRVFLSGDACHTHSSGSAQGLNTGIHDAVNLSWKLALRIRGLVKENILSSYEGERKPIVQRVIDNDKTISQLISGFYPPRFEGRKEHPRDILTEWFSDMNMQSFTLGLGISYSKSLLNKPGVSSMATINPGERGPDVSLTKLGTSDPIRLHSILKNHGKFHIVVFAGETQFTRSTLKDLHSALTSSSSLLSRLKDPRLFTWTTISTTVGPGSYEVFDFRWIGKVGGKLYFDAERKAHGVYGVDVAKGAVVLFRPDGWISAVVGPNVDEMGKLAEWIGEFLELNSAR